MANPFYVAPLGGLQGVQQIQQGMGAIAQRSEQSKLEEQQAQAQQAVVQAFESGDPMSIRNVMLQYPEMAGQAKSAFGFTNEATEKVARETYRRALADPENAAQYMQQGIQQVAELGGRPEMMGRDLEMLQQNPEAAIKNMRAGYAALASEEEFGALFPDAVGPNIGQYNPRDYTTDSFAEFTKTGDPSVLRRYAAQRSVDIGGVPHVFDPAFGGYRPAGVSGAQGQAPITPESVGASEAVIVRAKEGAKQEAAAQSPEQIRKTQEAASQAELNISNFEDISRQADTLLGNEEYIDAMTGISAKIPAIPGTARFDARVAFDQFKDTLTLGNLDKMSGVLTDRDIQVLASAAGGIEPGMSKEALTSRLNKIKEIFASKTEAERRKLQTFMQQSQKGEQQSSDLDSLINKYAPE